MVLVTPGVKRLEPNSGATAAALGGGGAVAGAVATSVTFAGGGGLLGLLAGTGAVATEAGSWEGAALLLLRFEGAGAGGVSVTPGVCNVPEIQERAFKQSGCMKPATQVAISDYSKVSACSSRLGVNSECQTCGICRRWRAAWAGSWLGRMHCSPSAIGRVCS